MDEASQAEMQERMGRATSPGKPHEALGFFLGTWDVEMVAVMPGAPEQSWAGTSTFEWLMEGRWLQERLEGELFGAPFRSASIRGYDSFARAHVVVTVSSADTAMNLARGPAIDPEGKVVAVYGTLDEYTTGELHKPFKAVSRITGDDRHVLEIWDLGMGEAGSQVLEYRYTRRS